MEGTREKECFSLLANQGQRGFLGSSCGKDSMAGYQRDETGERGGGNTYTSTELTADGHILATANTGVI